MIRAKAPQADATRADATRAGESDAARRNGKSPGAFRTTGEVAAELDLPAHVLRFWEAKFPQVKPLKRGGGRRYYRPEDVALLRRIRECLYREGYTIRGVQKLLRDGALRGDKPAPPPADEAPSTLFVLEPIADPPEPASSPAPSRQALRDTLVEVHRELQGIRAMLDRFVPP